MVICFLCPSASSTWIRGDFVKDGKAPVWGTMIGNTASFTLSDDGTRAALSAESGVLKCINGITGDEIWTYNGESNSGIRSEISADGKYIIACTYDDILFFSTSSSTPSWIKPIDDLIEWSISCSISDDGARSLIVYNDTGFLYSREGQLIREYDFGDFNYAKADLSGDGESIIATNGNNVVSGTTLISYFKTNSTTPLWTRELVGTGVRCEISRTGDVAFITQCGMGKFTAEDPWGISHVLPSGAVVGTADYFGGASLFLANGSLLWTVEMEGIESWDMDRGGNYFCFSGQNGMCILMNRSEIESCIQKPEDWWVEFCSVSSDGKWAYGFREQLYVHDRAGKTLLNRPFKLGEWYSKCIEFTKINEGGSLVYVLADNILLAFDTGPYPMFRVVKPSEIFVNQPVEIGVEYHESELNVTEVEWYFESSNEPTAVTDATENYTHTFTDNRPTSCIVVLRTEEGYAGMAEVYFEVEEEETRDSSIEITLLLISTALACVMFYSKSHRRRNRDPDL
ncbi:MAG: hypothetical protein ACMUIG_05810 [Thermoplasmatota archaeon]